MLTGVVVVPCVSCIEVAKHHHGPLPTWADITLWSVVGVTSAIAIVVVVALVLGHLRGRSS